MTEKWMLQTKRADFHALAARFGVSPVLIRCIVNRGVNTEEGIRRFLFADYRDEYDPHLMKGAEEAARRILAAVRRGEKIMIASDFDVDGIFSGWILLTAIRDAGGDVYLKAPDRTRDGYGVNVRMVEEAYAGGCRTMVTCDNGIAAFAATARAKELGMQVIVTDHHECAFEPDQEGERKYILPEADVIVNPHQPGETYPFHGLCGAGVAYKVCRLIYELRGEEREKTLPLLEYAAIATVADVMDLVDENRILVKEGLKRLPNTANAGLKALIRVCGLSGKELAAWHIGFVIGPCFNTAGRLDTVERAFKLLDAGPAEAEPLAESLKEMNESRKNLTVQGVKEAVEWVERQEKMDDILVIPLPDCHESIVGIVAGRIRELYHHPVIVLTRTENGWKGSGRSNENWDMFLHLNACRDLMTKFGGHPMAAGMTVPEENLEALRARLNKDSGLTPKDFLPIIRIDVALPLEYISESFIQELSLLQPCGKGNPSPLFAENSFRILSPKVLGKNRNVLKMTVENASGKKMDAIYFGDIPAFDALVAEKYGDAALADLYRGRTGDVILALTYVPAINEYMGTRRLQIEVKNIR